MNVMVGAVMLQPAVLLQHPMMPGDAPVEPEHQGEGVFRDGLGRERHGQDRDSAAPGSIDINPIQSHAGAHDDLETGRLGECFRIQLHRAAQDDNLGIRQQPGFLGGLRMDDDGAFVMALEPVQCVRREMAEDGDLHDGN